MLEEDIYHHILAIVAGHMEGGAAIGIHSIRLERRGGGKGEGNNPSLLLYREPTLVQVKYSNYCTPQVSLVPTSLGTRLTTSDCTYDMHTLLSLVIFFPSKNPATHIGSQFQEEFDSMGLTSSSCRVEWSVVLVRRKRSKIKCKTM